MHPTELEVNDTIDSESCFLPKPFHWNQQRRKIKIKALRKTWCLHFSNSELLIHQ